jgi:hypothetical protein
MLAIVQSDENVALPSHTDVGQRSIVEGIDPPVTHGSGEEMGEPGTECAAMSHNDNLFVAAGLDDLVQCLTYALKKGKALLAAGKLKGQVASILPACIDFGHRFAKALHGQTADTPKADLAQPVADYDRQVKLL